MGLYDQPSLWGDLNAPEALWVITCCAGGMTVTLSLSLPLSVWERSQPKQLLVITPLPPGSPDLEVNKGGARGKGLNMLNSFCHEADS